MSFSSDGWSQLLAVFSDGTAKLYSTKGSERTIASSCPYGDRMRPEEIALDLAVVCAFDSRHFQCDAADSATQTKERQVTAATFHPGFGLFGGQQSVVLGGDGNFDISQHGIGGEVLKWNSDGVMCTRKGIAGAFNTLYLPSIMTESVRLP